MVLTWSRWQVGARRFGFGGHELQRTRWRARGDDTAKKAAALPVGPAK